MRQGTNGAHDGPSEGVELDESLCAPGNLGHGRVDRVERFEPESWESVFARILSAFPADARLGVCPVKTSPVR
jgi:hypothetical protein